MENKSFNQSRDGRGWPWQLKFFFGLVLVFLLLMASCSCFQMVDTGHVGVVTRFNRVTGAVMPEGFGLKVPWDAVHEMPVRTQSMDEEGQVPSSEMLILTMKTTLQYHLNPATAKDVYQTLGPAYRTFIEQNFISAIREATSAHKGEELFSAEKRDVISVQAADLLRKTLDPRGIVVERVLLKDIRPPQMLKEAIESKQRMEQESLAMQFRLTKERQEADRKRVEAQGIKDFQDIVRKGIDEQLLVWKGIEATETLAKSPNTKIIVIGDKRGLPLILGEGH